MLRVATDVGGTFTDLVYFEIDEKSGKALSIKTAKSDTTPSSYEKGVFDAYIQNEFDYNSDLKTNISQRSQGDILSDIPAAVVDKAAATEFYNPFSEEGQARNLERSKGFLPEVSKILNNSLKNLGRHALHSKSITFSHPSSKELKSISAKIPINEEFELRILPDLISGYVDEVIQMQEIRNFNITVVNSLRALCVAKSVGSPLQ